MSRATEFSKRLCRDFCWRLKSRIYCVCSRDVSGIRRERESRLTGSLYSILITMILNVFQDLWIAQVVHPAVAFAARS